MKLQVAFDLQSSYELLKLMESLADLIDIIEIGTPLIMNEGLKSLSRIKKEFPDQILLADLKIMDAGALEARIGFDAGADLVTVLGLASRKTLSEVKKTSEQYGGKVVVDLINHLQPEKRWTELSTIGMEYCCIHTAHDDTQDGKNSLDNLKIFHKIHGGSKLAVAGGIQPGMIKKIKRFQPEIVVVGSYITCSERPREATKNICLVMD